jgi:hypothetical protein
MGPLDAIASGLRDQVRGRADTAAIAALEQERMASMRSILDAVDAYRGSTVAHPSRSCCT